MTACYFLITKDDCLSVSEVLGGLFQRIGVENGRLLFCCTTFDWIDEGNEVTASRTAQNIVFFFEKYPSRGKIVLSKRCRQASVDFVMWKVRCAEIKHIQVRVE